MKMIGHGLSRSLKDIMAGDVALSSVLHIESNARLPNEAQVRNFVSSTVSTSLVSDASDIMLSLWDLGRLVHNPNADRLAAKYGTWRRATADEAGRNIPAAQAMKPI